MTLQELVCEIDQQPAWEKNGRRAPHKPLTLLYALGHALRGARLVSYRDAEPELARLLDRFGPPRATQHPEHPVWRLRRYGGAATSFWQIVGDTDGIEGAGGNPRPQLMRDRLEFGLSESAWQTLRAHPASARALAAMLAAEIVPWTLQRALLEAVGIDMPTDSLDAGGGESDAATLLGMKPRTRVSTTRLQRDPAFSRKVLDAYDRVCAICSISPTLGGDRFGLEAAHIRWVKADGPDEVPNGLCLCRMHHEALDWGAVKIDGDLRVRISPKLERSLTSEATFTNFEGIRIHLPKDRARWPNESMLQWHWREVFRQ